ncbi:hypothetical protein AB0N17_19850 [Streptomyces sp. NPDC051133]|uniref:SCO2400 family protein n=1 Tax=Streptomyces sp. NPDC051133 TaxID=3155521 RepID=UPI00343ABA4E
MDYCSSCRRHLNGALVCPGCGAYAPDIAPPGTTTARTATTATAVMAAPGVPAVEPPTASGMWLGGPPADGTAPAADVSEGPAAEVEGVRTRPGRAARRRQLARWKKTQRRAVVATAVALVGGGLTIATMDRHSGDRAQAATAPDNRRVGDTQEQSGEPAAVPASQAPASTPSTGRRTGHAAPQAQSPAAAPHQQSAATAAHAAPQGTRPDSAAPPRQVTISTPQTQAQAPAHSSTGTAPVQTSTAAQPAPAASTGGTGSNTSNTSGASNSSGTSNTTGTSGAHSGPAATSPTQVCLLVLCLG